MRLIRALIKNFPTLMNERLVETVYKDYLKCPFLFVAWLTHAAPRCDLSGGCVRSEKSWAEPVGAAPERALLLYDLSLPKENKL